MQTLIPHHVLENGQKIYNLYTHDLTVYTGDNYQTYYYSEQYPTWNGKCFTENFNLEVEQDKIISIPVSGGVLDLTYQHDKKILEQSQLGSFKIAHSSMQLKINNITLELMNLLQKDTIETDLVIVPNVFLLALEHLNIKQEYSDQCENSELMKKLLNLDFSRMFTFSDAKIMIHESHKNFEKLRKSLSVKRSLVNRGKGHYLTNLIYSLTAANKRYGLDIITIE